MFLYEEFIKFIKKNKNKNKIFLKYYENKFYLFVLIPIN